MLRDAVECEVQFADDLVGLGIPGLTVADLRIYLESVGDRRLSQLGIPVIFGSKNPFTFMELQDVQELTNFFERKVSAYQIGVSGSGAFDAEF